MNELFIIEYGPTNEVELNVGEVSFEIKNGLDAMSKRYYFKGSKPNTPETNYDVNIHLKDKTPFGYQPRRLSYTKINAVKEIIVER